MQDEMQLLFKHIRQLVGSDNPVLDHVASYYFRQPGKHFRPLVVYLVGAATQTGGVPCEGQVSRTAARCCCCCCCCCCCYYYC
jgi:geranylgeranyl pyrophosphate synthase